MFKALPLLRKACNVHGVIKHKCSANMTDGERNGNPLQYSRLENSMDRGAWRATVHGVAKSGTRLSDEATR